MKKHMSFLLIAILLISCNSFHLEKRRYMKGFYLSNSLQNIPEKKDKENSSKVEKPFVNRPIPGSEKLKPTMKRQNRTTTPPEKTQ